MHAPGRRVALGWATVCLGGCGFRAVYAPQSAPAGLGQSAGTQANLAQIQVALIPERAGQLLRQALQQQLDRGEGLRKRYELAVSYSIAVDQVGFQQDSSVTRERLLGTGIWTLKALDTGAVVTNGLVRSLDGLDVLDQQYFAADIANETAQRRLAQTIADLITLQVAAFFSRRSTLG